LLKVKYRLLNVLYNWHNALKIKLIFFECLTKNPRVLPDDRAAEMKREAGVHLTGYFRNSTLTLIFPTSPIFAGLKTIAFILAFFVLLLSVIPCCVLSCCPEEQETAWHDAQERPAHPAEEEDCGNCSPFFNCPGCSGFYVALKITCAQESRVFAAAPNYISYETASRLSHFTANIWQPPRMPGRC
jgi:hypothetical protein